jgi:hypothetical protein
MTKRVALEFLGRQCDEVLEEIAATKALMDECLAVMKAANETD